MLKKAIYRGMLVACACVLLGGCRKPKGGTSSDVVMPDDYGQGTELGMSGDRFGELGERITDVRFDNVHFSYDSFQINAAEVAKVEAVAQFMRENGRVQLVAEGHCDERGSREYNMSLGEQRALSVRAHLIGLGIDAARIQTKSFGEERPLDPGHGEAAWRMNRRVECALYR